MIRSARMGRGSELSEEERRLVMNLHNQGVSRREIAKAVGRSRDSIGRVISRNGAGAGLRSGRPKKLSDRSERRITRCASNRSISTREIRRSLTLNVSKHTVWRVLKSCDHLRYRKKLAKPPLTVNHMQARFDWSLARLLWNEEWKSVIFSDEKKFNLDGPDGLAYYWRDLRKEEQYFSKRQSGGGSVMVWAAFGWNGRTSIRFIEGTLNSVRYQQVLLDTFFPVVDNLAEDPFIFQQDNAPATQQGHGWPRIMSLYYHGQHAPQTSIPSRIFGVSW